MTVKTTELTKNGTKKQPHVPRHNMVVQMDFRRPEHVELYQYHKQLKKERNFRPVIVNGFALMRDLSQKDTTRLMQLFPFIEDYLESEVQRRVAQELAKQQELMSRLERIEARISATPLSGVDSRQYILGEGLQPDAFDLGITESKADKEAILQNFMAGMAAMDGNKPSPVAKAAPVKQPRKPRAKKAQPQEIPTQPMLSVFQEQEPPVNEQDTLPFQPITGSLEHRPGSAKSITLSFAAPADDDDLDLSLVAV